MLKRKISNVAERIKSLSRHHEDNVGVYLSSRVRAEAIEGNTRISELLASGGVFRTFLPQTISPQTHHEGIEEAVYRRCVTKIEQAKVTILMADTYGIDCGWEIGYAKGKGRAAVAVVGTEKGLHRIREDWMVKGSLDAVMITDKHIYEIASQDVMLRNKSLILVELHELPNALLSIVRGKKRGA
jgi:nucleoside 2-deoxyribosyltransferase